MKHAPIPQFEIPFRDGDTFALVAERGPDIERIEAERRQAEEMERARREFHARHQMTLEQAARHAELVEFHHGRGWWNCAHKSLERLEAERQACA